METPPVLSYDKPDAISARRSHWIIPGYCAGVQSAGVVHCVVSFGVLTRDYPDTFARIIYGLVLPLGFALTSLLPQTIFLGLALWVKRKVAKAARFRGFRAAFLWGAWGAACCRGRCCRFGRIRGTSPPDWIWLVALGWFVFLPIMAAMFLCYRSHARD